MANNNVLPRIIGLVFSNALIPISLLLFATGFFPYKPLLPGLAQYESSDYGPPPEPPFDRLVFMVVDALRSDFVFAEDTGFEFTQGLIRNGEALPFTANARSPTVTMPRIKAITTGSIPSFLDVILNLDEGDTSSSLSAQDTWLAQMKAKNTGKMIMYGDDTWLKLFPETFDRADGTSSFFVSDFTEVDNNVTRHIGDELQNSDWNTMILHYLGLDHIGHKSGPRSINMVPKQREMDGIVRELYEAMSTQDHLGSTLLVLCGDHGMNDAGNHGASSPGETSAALVFMSPKLKSITSGLESPLTYQEDFRYYGEAEQSDLAPTLGALLGFPVPQNSLGTLMSEFLPFWTRRNDQAQLLLRNARQILRIVTATFGSKLFETPLEAEVCVSPQDDAQDLACHWQSVNAQRQAPGEEGDLDKEWVASLSEWLSKAQDIMSSMASNFDMSKLALGSGAIVVAAFVCAIITPFGPSHVPFVVMTATYGVMMFASSYVEEEHHFWYWMTSAWIASVGIRALPRSSRPIQTMLCCFLALGAARLVRGWNQTGQKHAGEPDIVKSFLASTPVLLWSLVSLAYFSVGCQIYRQLSTNVKRLLPRVVAVVAAVSVITAAGSFKIAFTREDSPELMLEPLGYFAPGAQVLPLVTQARTVFIQIAALVLYAVCGRFTSWVEPVQTTNSLHSLYTLLAMTQSRTVNIPLFLLFQIQLSVLSLFPLDVACISTASVLLQYMSFFAFGGTNAISSVDLSNAYNGVSGFNVVGVGILTFLSNWAGPIFWTSGTNLLLQQHRARTGNSRLAIFVAHVSNLTFFATCSVAFTMFACTALRTHLFIWTVFSPKYLYCMAWNIAQHLLVNIFVAGGLIALSE